MYPHHTSGTSKVRSSSDACALLVLRLCRRCNPPLRPVQPPEPDQRLYQQPHARARLALHRHRLLPAHLLPHRRALRLAQPAPAGRRPPHPQAPRRQDRQPLPRVISNATTGSLTINVTADPSLQTIDEDESYTLTTTASAITIKAPTTTGAIHALETLLQLVQPSGSAYIIPAVTITDSPRFRWRGLMIDCGRHFEPLDVLKRNLDAMAAVKLNVFHWHLTEDQGFRIESKLYPQAHRPRLRRPLLHPGRRS